MEQRFPFLHSLQDFSLERGKSRSFLIFLALSFFFWMITKFSNQYTEILEVEVRFDTFPMGVVPVSDTSSEVQITLTATGFQLLFYKLFDTSIVLDSEKGVFDGGKASVSLQMSFQEIQDQFFGSPELKAIFPSTVHFEYSKLGSKRLPVVLQSDLKIAAGYGIAESIQFDPDSISAMGPENVLDTLKSIQVIVPNKKNITKSFTGQFNLINAAPKQLEFSQTDSRLSVIIDRFSEKTIKIPIRLLNVPDSIGLKLFPSTIDLSFAASLSKIKTITASDFMISCDFKLLKEGDQLMKLKLTKTPSQVQNLRWKPKQVEYLIRK